MSDDPLSSGSASNNATFDSSVPLTSPADPQVAACMKWWLSASTNAHSADTRLFAKLIAERDVRDELPLLGLKGREWNALLGRHFAGASAFGSTVATNADQHPVTPIAATSHGQVNTDHTDFLHSLHALLLGYASAAVNPDDAHALATIIAHACLRPDHLWRDLGLAGRDEVTWMLTR
jgi:nitrogen fixation protein NifQ